MSGRGPGSPTPGSPVTRAGLAGAKHRRSRGIAKRMQKKRRETGTRESERLIVPTKSGNSTRGNPPEGRRRRVADPLEGHTAGTSKPGPVFTKPQRIAGSGTPRASRTRDLTSRMPKWGKSGSVGARAGDRPGDPACDWGGECAATRKTLTRQLALHTCILLRVGFRFDLLPCDRAFSRPIRRFEQFR